MLKMEGIKAHAFHFKAITLHANSITIKVTPNPMTYLHYVYIYSLQYTPL